MSVSNSFSKSLFNRSILAPFLLGARCPRALISERSSESVNSSTWKTSSALTKRLPKSYPSPIKPSDSFKSASSIATIFASLFGIFVTIFRFSNSTVSSLIVKSAGRTKVASPSFKSVPDNLKCARRRRALARSNLSFSSWLEPLVPRPNFSRSCFSSLFHACITSFLSDGTVGFIPRACISACNANRSTSSVRRFFLISSLLVDGLEQSNS
mmetsp:Transcript_18569/g.30281  ORF Transcript_18569/g.30281 Transcript_18569/m.30281 type:complete len:212 (-) Transcript_18569:386-1021(-)